MSITAESHSYRIFTRAQKVMAIAFENILVPILAVSLGFLAWWICLVQTSQTAATLDHNGWSLMCGMLFLLTTFGVAFTFQMGGIGSTFKEWLQTNAVLGGIMCACVSLGVIFNGPTHIRTAADEILISTDGVHYPGSLAPRGLFTIKTAPCPLQEKLAVNVLYKDALASDGKPVKRRVELTLAAHLVRGPALEQAVQTLPCGLLWHRATEAARGQARTQKAASFRTGTVLPSGVPWLSTLQVLSVRDTSESEN